MFRHFFGQNSTATSRVASWGHLAKLCGLYTDTKPQTTVDDIIRDITARNAANRNGLLPKDNIRLEDRVTYDSVGNVVR
ncbi:MAG: hypothetical protein QNK36_18760 [Colwellia sp.]|nr:hypothetical protein [Colwellia sp.]